jgi:hypothetical protein
MKFGLNIMLPFYSSNIIVWIECGEGRLLLKASRIHQPPSVSRLFSNEQPALPTRMFQNDCAGIKMCGINVLSQAGGLISAELRVIVNLKVASIRVWRNGVLSDAS